MNEEVSQTVVLESFPTQEQPDIVCVKKLWTIQPGEKVFLECRSLYNFYRQSDLE